MTDQQTTDLGGCVGSSTRGSTSTHTVAWLSRRRLARCVRLLPSERWNLPSRQTYQIGVTCGQPSAR